MIVLNQSMPLETAGWISYMEKGKQKYLMEVKGCTLEIDGVGYFPDAPTEREELKHLRELAAACGQGYKCWIALGIQMEEIQ